MPCNSAPPSRCGSVLPVRVWFTEAALSFVFFAGLTFFFLSWFVSRQFTRFGRFAGWPAIVSLSVLLYGCSLVAFTLFPLPDFSDPAYCMKQASVDHWQLVPFASLDDVTAVYASDGVLAMLTSRAFLQVAMNVVFFLPLGFLLAYRSRRSLGFAALASLGVSLSIELTQGTGLWGLAPCPYRLADVDDLMTNTAGGILGWFVGFAARRLLPDPTPQSVPDPGPPGPGRQAAAVLLDVQVFALAQVGVQLALVVFERIRRTTTTLDDDIVDDPSSVPFSVSMLLVTVALFVVFPLLRKDRATPGMASVHLALVRIDDSGERARWWAVMIRWAIRWLPVVVFGVVALLVVLPIEAITAWRGKAKRSLTAIITRSALVTRQHLVGTNRSEHDSVDI